MFQLSTLFCLQISLQLLCDNDVSGLCHVAAFPSIFCVIILWPIFGLLILAMVLSAPFRFTVSNYHLVSSDFSYGARVAQSLLIFFQCTASD